MTRDDMAREESTRNPIFLFQSRVTFGWYTETVFLTRAEGERWGRAHEYRWGASNWRVYAVPAEGDLVDVLRRTDP